MLFVKKRERERHLQSEKDPPSLCWSNSSVLATGSMKMGHLKLRSRTQSPFSVCMGGMQVFEPSSPASWHV